MDMPLYLAAVASVFSFVFQDILLMGISIVALFFLYNPRQRRDKDTPEKFLDVLPH